jgi:hypothetical protein
VTFLDACSNSSFVASAPISRAMLMKRFDCSGSPSRGFGLRGMPGMIPKTSLARKGRNQRGVYRRRRVKVIILRVGLNEPHKHVVDLSQRNFWWCAGKSQNTSVVLAQIVQRVFNALDVVDAAIVAERIHWLRTFRKQPLGVHPRLCPLSLGRMRQHQRETGNR